MATAITTSRQFRKGRVLLGDKSDVVLVNSPAPRVWSIIMVPHENERARGKTVTYSSRTSAALLKARFKKWDTRLDVPLDTLMASAVISEGGRRLGDLPYPVRMALTRTGGAGIGRVVPAGATSKIDAAIDALEAGLSAPKITVEDVTPKKASAASGKRASAFVTPVKPEEAYWYESENDRRLTRDFISLHKADFVVNLMIAGPSGSGKTVGVERLGKELGIPVHKINCQAITTPEKWLGQMMADPEKGTYFQPSQHIQWVERSHPDCVGAEFCIMLYDEITRLRAELNNMTYSLFDTQRGLEVPQMGRTVHMDKHNLVIATANIGAAYAGTFGQDRAFRERFAMTIERPFPPRDEEVKIVRSYTSNRISESDALKLAQIAEVSRDQWTAQEIELPISTRTLNTWGLLVAGGYTIMQAAEYTVLPMYSEDGKETSDRSKVRLEIQRKAGA